MEDHFRIESGANGLCLLTIIDNGEEFFLPLVEWPGVYECVRAYFYQWLELAKQHTKRENLLRRIDEVLREDCTI